MTTIVTFYNNKGGVSKTTTLFNVGAFLSKVRGKKVLLVDFDPQCNATELFFASTDLLDDPDSDLPGTSIYRALSPRFFGEASRIDPAGIELTESALYPGMHLLRGDFEFAMAERYLATAAVQAITESVHDKNTYLVIWRLLNELAAHHSFDYVLCDVGPSTGALTRMVVLACDGFFIPLTPDRFCNQAVRVLAKVMSDWVSRHSEISRTFPPFGMTCFEGRPKFLGGIIQNFKIHTAAKMKRSYETWQRRIAENMASTMLQPGAEVVPSSVSSDQPFVANIRDVGTLAPVAQMFGRAIFDVQQEHTANASTTGDEYRGVVWKGWVERMAEYQSEIEKIVQALP